MKTKFFKIAWLILTVIQVVTGHSQVSDSTGSDAIVYQEPNTPYVGLGNGIPSRDQLTETVWLSTGLAYAAGGIPYDILYVDDDTYPPLDSRIFIYTERKLLAYRMWEYEWSGIIDLSEYGSQTLFKLTQPLLPRSREKHLAYNPDKHELYCLTQDLKILIIDPNTVEIIGEIIPDTDIGLLDWAIIKYDPVSEYLFLGLCKFHGATVSELLAFNTIDYSNEYSIDFSGDLNDFSFNPNPLDNLLYLSSYNEIQVRNTEDGSKIDSYTMPCRMGVILNAYNEITGLNNTYCLPKSEDILQNNALIFEGNNTTPRTITLEKGNFGCGIYNAPSNKVYIGYTNTSLLRSGFISFNPDIENMTDHPLENQDIIMDMANLEERVFISTKDHIYCCKNGSYYPDYTLNSPGSYFYRIAATKYVNDPRIWATNMMDQSLQVAYAPSEFTNLEWFEPWLLSGAALQGFFNHVDQKLYLYYGMPDPSQDHKFMYIYDPVTEDITSVKIDHDPIGVVLDENTNYIYFSTHNYNIIRRYDASDNSWLEPINLPEGYSSCYEMYLSNRNLYCSVIHLSQEGVGTPCILVYDLENPLTNPIIIPILGISDDEEHQITSHYTLDESGRVYVSVRFAWSNQGRVIRINENFSITDFGINFEHPDEILYDQLHNKILLKYLQSDRITILDFETSPPSSHFFQPRIGLDIIDMEIDPISSFIYFDYNDEEENGYIDIYTTDGSTLVKTVQVGYRALALKYNPLNGLMYVHVPANSAANRKDQLWSIDPAAFNVYSMDLGQNEGHWINGYYLTDMILDDANNNIYSVSAHGNIKVIACSDDQLTLQPRTWNWLSFPRLDQENSPVDAVPVLQGIHAFPEYLQMQNKPLQDADPGTISITYHAPNEWTGELNKIQSKFGYKIETDNHAVSYLTMTGSVLNSNTGFDIFDGHENWVGYFLPETQFPANAIPQEFQDKIDGMQGHYWYCYKENNHTKNTGYWWRCACSQGNIELKYADMIVIYPSEDIPDFHWQYGFQQQPNDPRNPSHLFQYQEQPEYDAIFIELDTMNRPEEIGAFAGDSCIGATTVLPTDTTVLICGYTQGFEGQEITFDLAYPTKSSRLENDDYLVLNNKTGICEKRRIIAGEKQPYFMVSFKKDPEAQTEAECSWLQCRPNPVDKEVIVSYFINYEAKPDIKLINNLGITVMSWQPGNQNAGSYTFKFSTTGLPAGCYQISIDTGYKIINQKLLIIH
jgi:hypothetical protein